MTAITKQLNYLEKQPYFKQWLCNIVGPTTKFTSSVTYFNPIDAFNWQCSPEGHNFWKGIAHNVKPYICSTVTMDQLHQIVQLRYKDKYPELFL